MKRGLLSSAARGTMTAPVRAGVIVPPLTIGVVMAGDATARVTVEGASFLLPDEQAAMTAALSAIADPSRPAILSVVGAVGAPQRVIGGLIHLVRSAGFAQVSVVAAPAAR